MERNEITKADFSKRFMADLLEGMPGGFFVYRGDESEEILYANKKLLEIFECDTWEQFVELTGGTFNGMVYPLDRLGVNDFIMRARMDGRSKGITRYRIRTRKGNFKYVQNYANFVDDYVEGGLLYVFLDAARAQYDQLTGLPDMVCFLDNANSRNNAIIRSGQIPAIVAFNMIGFKTYNTRYSRAEGNKLLIAFGDILQDMFGKENSSRFGEDHFYVFTGAGGLKKRVTQVFDRMAEANNGRTLPIRAGVFVYDSDDMVSASEACDRAKLACDVDRHTYMSVYNLFDKNLRERTRVRDYVLLNITRALREHQIEVYYQPQMDAKTGRLKGAEALARWNSPEAGFLSPGKFIPVLEEANLTYKLDIYVIEQIAKDIRKSIDAGIPIVPISFNFSRTDFETCDPYKELTNIVDKYHLTSEMFRVEITESTLMSDPDKIHKQMDQFRKSGYEVLMDDFGSAYSSLSTLRDFDFDEIKIDMGFMRNFSEKSRKIIKPMISLADSLQVHTITEGVETEEQLSFPKEVGCEAIQGYYFSKPIPYNQFVEKLMKYEAVDALPEELINHVKECLPIESRRVEAIHRHREERLSAAN